MANAGAIKPFINNIFEQQCFMIFLILETTGYFKCGNIHNFSQF